MDNIIKQFYEAPLLHWVAFACSILYLIFATFKSNLCWIFAIIGSFIFAYLCVGSKLYFDSVLQLFYVVMAVVGWVSWRKSKDNHIEFQIYNLKKHLVLIVSSTAFSFLVGYLADKLTDQAYPYVDAMIFSFSVMATFLTTERVPSTWLYFIVIDLVAIPVYWTRNLELMAVLSFVMAVMAVFAYLSWRKLMLKHA